MPSRPERPIAFIILQGERLGGMERRFARLISYYQSQGVPVRLFTSRAAYRTLAESSIRIDRRNITFIDARWLRPILGETRARKAALVGRILFSLSPRRHRHLHLVNDPGGLSTFIAQFSRLLPPLSIVIGDSRHDYPTSDIPPLTRYRAVDCLSEDIADHVIREGTKLGAPEITDLVHVSPCSFVDIPECPPLDISKRDIDLVFASRFVTGKGIDLLEHMAPVPDGTIFQVRGTGPVTPRIPRADIGFEPNLPSLLRRTKIFLSLQDLENYPSQSLLEAMAAGCAIIATDVGHTRKLVDETCGILIPRSASALNEAITSLLIDSERVYRLGIAAAKRVRSDHSVKRFAEYYLEDIVADQEEP